MDIKEVQKIIKWLTEKRREMNLTVSEGGAVMAFLEEVWQNEINNAVEECSLPPGTRIIQEHSDSSGFWYEHLMVITETELEIRCISSEGNQRTITKMQYLLGNYREE